MQISITLPPEFVRADRRFCSTVIQQQQNCLKITCAEPFIPSTVVKKWLTSEDQQHELFLIK